MGGRMPFYRMVSRNGLYGDYTWNPYREPDDVLICVHCHTVAFPPKGSIRGDISRMVRDELGDPAVLEYAEMAGVSPETVRTILRAVFDVPEPGCLECKPPYDPANPTQHTFMFRCREHQAKATYSPNVERLR